MENKKWTSKYSPKKQVSTHQYILEIVCENFARRNNKELPFHFWKLKEWKWNYIKNSHKCKELREKHGDLKVLDFVIKKRIWSLQPSWIEEALTNWVVAQIDPTKENLDIKTEDSSGKKTRAKTNIFKGLE